MFPWALRPSSRWNGTGAPWCPTCRAVVAAHRREAEPLARVFPQNLLSAAETSVLNSLGALPWLLRASSCAHRAHSCHAQAVKRAGGTAWREDTGYIIGLGRAGPGNPRPETETLDAGQDGTALTTVIMPVRDRSRSSPESFGWQVQGGQPSGRRRKGAGASGSGFRR